MAVCYVNQRYRATRVKTNAMIPFIMHCQKRKQKEGPRQRREGGREEGEGRLERQKREEI